MSVLHRCDIWKATDSQWYMLVGDFEHASEPEDCTTYGPFNEEEDAYQFACSRLGNPGGYMLDASGSAPVPNECVRPRRHKSIW
ncbi:hypothetical protein [Pseudomonas putida]|uniref:Uncharacterized protein n=1 Tax=Pseudomonas putida TaxID=303 RepID=A0A8I1EBP3_PSEPU|nr:hypothetical protein [Pseudomonas putida]MBI6883092.1 hypothetical protein [Pseudomonas putida]